MSFRQCAAALCFALFMACAPFFVFRPSAAQTTPQYKGVLNLWHVDGFEGGSGSRAEFLKKRTIEFESKNKGVFISVQSYTYEQVRQKLADGGTFDLISFSAGVGELVLGKVSAYGGAVNVRDDLLDGGMIDGKIFALPWAFGGYALFSRGDEQAESTVCVGLAQFNDPFRAALRNRDKMGKICKWGAKDLTSFQAYEAFSAKNEFSALLGTQRDLARFELKQSKGEAQDLKVECFDGFTDLVQYVAFCDNGGGRGEYAQAFMQYLTGDEAQKKLASIRMFSPALEIYESGLHREMQTALSRPLETVNVFTAGDKLLQMRDDDRHALCGG